MSPINYFAGPEAYNSDFFDNTADASLAVSTPYLVLQGNISIAGATVSGGTVSFNNTLFNVYTHYINPSYAQPDINTYFTSTPAAFQPVWPNHLFPNSVFSPAATSAGNTFNGTLDCVGFGCRVLIATGSNDPQNNAYSLLHAQIDFNAIHFASLGIVPSALEIAIAFPVLLPGRWSYVAGFIAIPAIQGYDNQESQKLHQPDKTYTGVSKSGLSTAIAGDIVSFGYTAGHSNGHFMVLTAPPQLVPLTEVSNPEDFVAKVYRISVYDSTDSGSSLHFNDSRRNGNPDSCGIGYGELLLLANDQDQPVGFIFGPGDPIHYVTGTSEQADELIVAAITIARFQ
ncbi:hypothetical protein [Mucilaginibacter jinjuensis]|uniref:Uncharacterized protein n=1 Tax=Mucilaginibacter jinjuensis TaxID=1176721 RepID=A0ABY7TB96_9SPHI|nr:hypothetical protein [Mucilaginibacter jinjuensis]WCT13785.1 hypothetical protein PQO05_07535 [Mucilaginibacter jinjuensis]